MGDMHKTPPNVRLKYKKGDLIVKQGDYGLSIYKILKGNVRVFSESESEELALATLGPGQIIGDMAFWGRSTEARTASVRAIDALELEVWHPASLAEEYRQMPHIIRYITDQTLKRLVRMNQLVAQLDAKKKKGKKKPPQSEKGASQREYYRKKLDQDCLYRTSGAPKEFRLNGKIKDISRGGICMEIGQENTRGLGHNDGDELYISMTLPAGKELDFKAKIMSVRREIELRKIILGMKFTEISSGAEKSLGFFLMA